MPDVSPSVSSGEPMPFTDIERKAVLWVLRDMNPGDQTARPRPLPDDQLVAALRSARLKLEVLDA